MEIINKQIKFEKMLILRKNSHGLAVAEVLFVGL
jgi:hypothetical protein